MSGRASAVQIYLRNLAFTARIVTVWRLDWRLASLGREDESPQCDNNNSTHVHLPQRIRMRQCQSQSDRHGAHRSWAEMTRPARAPDESWAINLLLGELRSESSEWHEQPDAPTDRPDLLLSGPLGLRVACEITQVSLSEWYRWQNDRRLQLGVNQLDQAAVPREVDLWLANAIASKAPLAPDYLANASANEVWLLVHGGMNKVFDFFNLDDCERYDIPLLVKAAEAISHPFQRIYVGSSSGNRIVRVFPFNGIRHQPPDITDPSILKVLRIRSLEIQPRRGVNEVRIGNEYKPDRARMLPLLDSGRMRAK